MKKEEVKLKKEWVKQLQPYFDAYCIETEQTQTGFPDVLCYARKDKGLVPFPIFIELKDMRDRTVANWTKVKFPFRPGQYKHLIKKRRKGAVALIGAFVQETLVFADINNVDLETAKASSCFLWESPETFYKQVKELFYT